MPAAGAGKPYQHASAVAPNEAAASALRRAQTEQLAAAAAERRRAAEPKPNVLMRCRGGHRRVSKTPRRRGSA